MEKWNLLSMGVHHYNTVYKETMYFQIKDYNDKDES